MEVRQKLARSILLAFVLALTTLLVFGLWKGKAQKERQVAAMGDSAEADMKLTDMEYTEMQEGRRVWTLNAREARYFEKEQKTHLTAVRLVFYLEDGREVYLQSREGALFAGTKDIEVWGGVRATVPEGYEIASERALYSNEGQTIASRERVRIVGPDLELEGSRWGYVIPERKGYLEGEVKATLVVPSDGTVGKVEGAAASKP